MKCNELGGERERERVTICVFGYESKGYFATAEVAKALHLVDVRSETPQQPPKDDEEEKKQDPKKVREKE